MVTVSGCELPFDRDARCRDIGFELETVIVLTSSSPCCADYSANSVNSTYRSIADPQVIP